MLAVCVFYIAALPVYGFECVRSMFRQRLPPNILELSGCTIFTFLLLIFLDS